MVCYFFVGLLAEEADAAFTKMEWIETVKSVIAGYESMTPLSEKEKHANAAYDVFRFIQNCEGYFFCAC